MRHIIYIMFFFSFFSGTTKLTNSTQKIVLQKLIAEKIQSDMRSHCRRIPLRDSILNSALQSYYHTLFTVQYPSGLLVSSNIQNIIGFEIS